MTYTEPVRLKIIPKHEDAVKLLARIYNPDMVTDSDSLKLIGGAAVHSYNSNIHKNVAQLISRCLLKEGVTE